jgi:hypothetical protein
MKCDAVALCPVMAEIVEKLTRVRVNDVSS